MDGPSWQPDPFHRHEYRWWDSRQWTEHVSDHGVAGIDPLHVPEGPPHEVWAAPTLSPPRPAGPAAPAAPAPPAAAVPVVPAPPRRRNRSVMVAAAIVAVAALGAGGWLVLKGDSPASTATTSPAAITTAPAVAPTTVSPSTTSTSTTTSTTTLPPVSHSLLLRQAMPTAAEVPTDWEVYTSGGGTHDPETESNLCGGANSTALAIDAGSDAQIDGPTWDLPEGGWYGVEGFAFPDEASAHQFVDDLAALAGTCHETPSVTTKPETELQIFADGASPNAVWTLSERASTNAGTAPDADEVLLLADNLTVSTTTDGQDYSYVFTELQRVERYGVFVVQYWLDGSHSYTGFGNGAPDWSYAPTHDALSGATDLVRPVILEHLGG